MADASKGRAALPASGWDDRADEQVQDSDSGPGESQQFWIDQRPDGLLSCQTAVVEALACGPLHSVVTNFELIVRFSVATPRYVRQFGLLRHGYSEEQGDSTHVQKSCWPALAAGSRSTGMRFLGLAAAVQEPFAPRAKSRLVWEVARLNGRQTASAHTRRS